MNREIVIGIDGGGTHTRALAVDLDGHVLAYIETGGANPDHNTDAKHNVQVAIRGVIEKARCTPHDVRCLVAGFAGFDSGGRWNMGGFLYSLTRIDLSSLSLQ